MEKCQITKAQESKDVKVEDKVNVYHIFCYQWHCVHGIFTTGYNCKPTLYKEILQRLIVSVWTKKRDWYENNNWLLHHDSALLHNALSIHQFLTE